MTPAIWTGVFHTVPLDEALRHLHACGWQAFETSTEHFVMIDTAPDPAAQIDRACVTLSELDANMPQGHALLLADIANPNVTAREKDIGTLCRHLRIAARLGVRTVVMHPGKVQATPTPGELARVRELNVDGLRRLGDFAAERGLRIAVENVTGVGARTADDMLGLIAAVDHPAVGITLDTSHANIVGWDIPAAIRRFGDLLWATHMSDNDGSGDQHRTPGGGDICWPPIVNALREIGYTGLFNLEIPGERPTDGGDMVAPVTRALAVTLALLKG